MYYRYRVKNKDRHVVRSLVIIVLIAVAGYFSYKYRDYILFWKYTDNKLMLQLKTADSTPDFQNRKIALEGLVPVFDDYREKNPLKADAFFMSAFLYYRLGQASLPGSFSELLINDRLDSASPAARKQFLRTIKYIRKGMALQNGDSSDPAVLFTLARSCYYSSFLRVDEICGILSGLKPTDCEVDVESIRFCALVNILNKNEDAGFALLTEKGMVDNGIDGILFQATAERMVGRYTSAIMNYKKVLDASRDDRILNLVHVNLGKIYYNQSLYRESLAHFNDALKINERDTFSRIWIGKNYSALGYRDRAKAIWAEILATDRSNSEVKKLLGVM